MAAWRSVTAGGFIAFTDPEGQRLRLVDDGGDTRVAGGVPWEGSPVPREAGIRGLGAVELTVHELEPTAWVLGEVLGFRVVGEHVQDDGRVVDFEVGPGGPGLRYGWSSVQGRRRRTWEGAACTTSPFGRRTMRNTLPGARGYGAPVSA